jgi:hypothetical protein
MMLHPESDHHLLAPHDLAHHIPEDHRTSFAEVLRAVGGVQEATKIADVRGYEYGSGFEAANMVWHDDAHEKDERRELTDLVAEFLAADLRGFTLVATYYLARLATWFGLPEDADTPAVDARMAEYLGDARAR